MSCEASNLGAVGNFLFQNSFQSSSSSSNHPSLRSAESRTVAYFVLSAAEVHKFLIIIGDGVAGFAQYIARYFDIMSVNLLAFSERNWTLKTNFASSQLYMRRRTSDTSHFKTMCQAVPFKFAPTTPSCPTVSPLVRPTR